MDLEDEIERSKWLHKLNVERHIFNSDLHEKHSVLYKKLSGRNLPKIFKNIHSYVTPIPLGLSLTSFSRPQMLVIELSRMAHDLHCKLNELKITKVFRKNKCEIILKTNKKDLKLKLIFPEDSFIYMAQEKEICSIFRQTAHHPLIFNFYCKNKFYWFMTQVGRPSCDFHKYSKYMNVADQKRII